MANRLKMEQKALLRKLLAEGYSDRKIRLAMGLHRKTIAKYRNEWQQSQVSEPDKDRTGLSPPNDIEPIESVPPDRSKCPPEGVAHFQAPTDPPEVIPSKSRSATYHSAIKEKLQQGQSARSIYQDLVGECGFQDGYDSVKRYVRKLRIKAPRVYARMQYHLGEEAQADFGEGAPVLINGKYKKPHLFVMTLSASRKMYAEVVWKQDIETFIRCHENAFRFFGGIPKLVRIDNLKSGVLEAHLYEPELNPQYFSFSEHYGFVIVPCRVRTPQHKGVVESGVKYVQNNALKGKRFDTLEDQNAYLKTWNKTWASTRIHGTTKRQVQTMFEEERPFLQALPEKAYEFFHIGERKVHPLDSLIQVNGGYYAIPFQYMGQTVQVRYNSRIVKVYYRQELIRVLSVTPPGTIHPDRSCLPPSACGQWLTYHDRLFERCRKLGAHILAWAKAAEAKRSYAAYRAIQGVLALKKDFTPDQINAACAFTLAQEAFRYHDVKARLSQLKDQCDLDFPPTLIQDDPLIRNPKDYQLNERNCSDV